VVVIVRELAQGPALIAYWISDKPLEVSDLRQFIGQRLPHYMLPSYWVPMTEFPKTPNQKIDRKALPLPTQTGVSQEKNRSALLTPAEQVIADIFKQVLNHSQVTAYDNFFDLGGHSLLSMKVVEALYQRTGIRMHPGEMFQQTVGQLAAYYGDALLAQSASSQHGSSARSELKNQGPASVLIDTGLPTSPQTSSKKTSLLKRLLGG
jgi:hypothetical protein